MARGLGPASLFQVISSQAEVHGCFRHGCRRCSGSEDFRSRALTVIAEDYLKGDMTVITPQSADGRKPDPSVEERSDRVRGFMQSPGHSPC